ncbi:MAG: cytochrome c3 family protein [Magnetococcales bacterium]|nr:cytochrome c3 family protein [Magnetococcales bacterium]
MSNFKSIPVILLLVALAIGLRLDSAAGRNGGHLLNSRCQSCHLADTVDAKNGAVLIASQEKLCVECHANAVRLSHPSGFLPNRILKDQFPRDWKGSLTCSSCHFIHGTGPGLMRSSKRGADFCHECHEPRFFEEMADRGASVLASGHLDARQQSANNDLPLDAFTLQCLGCHSDQEGGDRRVGLRKGGVLQHNSSSMNHPIGVNYAQTSRQGGYRPLELLPAEILLPNGLVGCISCHEGYSIRHGKLVRANAGSALCLTCHDL